MSYLREERFDPLLLIDQGDAVNMEVACKLAQKMRNERRNQLLKSHGKQIESLKSWTLTNQLRQYSGFGQPDGRVRNVYYLNIYWKEA